MKYNSHNKILLSDFLSEVGELLQVHCKIKLKDLKTVQEFLRNSEGNQELIGELSLSFHLSERRDSDGCRMDYGEVIIIDKSEFILRTICNETYYDGRYENYDLRIEIDTPEEHLNDCFDSAKKAIEELISNPNSSVSFETKRFGIKTKRTTAKATI